jgi:hypothetical protein
MGHDSVCDHSSGWAPIASVRRCWTLNGGIVTRDRSMCVSSASFAHFAPRTFCGLALVSAAGDRLAVGFMNLHLRSTIQTLQALQTPRTGRLRRLHERPPHRLRTCRPAFDVASPRCFACITAIPMKLASFCATCPGVLTASRFSLSLRPTCVKSGIKRSLCPDSPPFRCLLPLFFLRANLVQIAVTGSSTRMIH